MQAPVSPTRRTNIVCVFAQTAGMKKNQIEGKVRKGAGDVEHPLDEAASKSCSGGDGGANGPLGLRAANDRLS